MEKINSDTREVGLEKRTRNPNVTVLKLLREKERKKTKAQLTIPLLWRSGEEGVAMNFVPGRPVSS